jgi:tol-pal system protein YbgF
MNAQQLNIDNVAHNLANVNTVGFKKSRVEFEDLVYQQTRAAGSATSTTGEAPIGLETGLGARPVATARDFRGGNLRLTSTPYDLAIEGFSSYVRSFPKSEFADNAQYYIGESYYQRGRWPEAVDAFTRLIATYPRSDVVGNAYYKRGLSYERMNQPEQSRADYELLVKTAGDSDSGRLAKQRLDALNRVRPQ